jgi:uncharacterized repeat protein (TIGR03803 family)
MYTLTTLANFNGTNGSLPQGNLIVAANGNIFGTASAGGTGYTGAQFSGNGTVFEVPVHSQTIDTLVAFAGPNGLSPLGNLVIDGSGNLYGVTANGGPDFKPNNNALPGYGTVFEVAAGTNSLSTLIGFDANTNGVVNQSGLVADSQGNMYGTTLRGGTYNWGYVYEVAAGTHTVTTLASFPGGASGEPGYSDLIADGHGNLFGVAGAGGDTSGVGDGTAFELAAGTHSISTVATFNGTNGSQAIGSLLADANGNLFGTTREGGPGYSAVGPNQLLLSAGDGTVFEIPAGTHTINNLANFDGTNGEFPQSGLIADANENLYGTTFYGGAYNDGSVFELDVQTDVLTTLFSFDYSDGSNPAANLTFGPNGNLYGTTEYGGTDNRGTVFELSPVPEPSCFALSVLAVVGLAIAVQSRRPFVSTSDDTSDGRLAR